MNSMITSKNPLRVGVVGAGKMGRHHLRIYSMLAGAKLTAVVDLDTQRARDAANAFQCQAFTHIEDLVGKVDAVSIAVPSRLHAKIGEYLLSHGIHCLIEKPLAMTETECHTLIKTAERKGMILLVGHVESFNPALQEMKKILQSSDRIYAIEAKRLGWNPTRIAGFDVVMDLMVHDLEIINSILNEPVLHMSSAGIKHKKLDVFEHAQASLVFQNGCVTNVTSSWISPRKTRSLEVIADIGTLLLDYTQQKLLYYPTLLKGSTHYPCDERIEHIFVRYQEPLMLELQNFLQSVESGVLLGVNGTMGLSALQLCWKIQEKLNISIPVREHSYV